MLRVGKMYMVYPTIRRLWVAQGRQQDFWRRYLPASFFTVKLVRIFKSSFALHDRSIDITWRVPHDAVEIYGLLNKPLNEDSIKADAKKVCVKFSRVGFAGLTLVELMTLLAAFEMPSTFGENYPAEIAAGLIKTYRDRGNIIRKLRNTHGFRNTKAVRETCLHSFEHIFS